MAIPVLEPKLLDIANQALTYCGITAVDDINKETQECQQIRICMQSALRDAMYDRDWGFNRVTFVLNRVDNDDPANHNLDPGYVKYGYVPSRRIFPPIRGMDDGAMYRTFRVDKESSLWVYQGPASVRVSSLELIDPVPDWVLTDHRDFIRFAGLCLAALIAGGITGNPQAGETIWSTNIMRLEKTAAAKNTGPTNYILKDPN